jgi:hypothetical protein
MSRFIFAFLQLQDSLPVDKYALVMRWHQTYGIAQDETLQHFDVLRHCGTHQERLKDFREKRTSEDLADVLVVAVRQDKISFIDNQRFERSQ